MATEIIHYGHCLFGDGCIWMNLKFERINTILNHIY